MNQRNGIVSNCVICVFPYGITAPVGRGLFLSKLHDNIYRHHTRYDSSGRVISPAQRTVPDNPQHSQETDDHAPDAIQTLSPSMRAAADPRLIESAANCMIYLTEIVSSLCIQAVIETFSYIREHKATGPGIA